EGLPIADRVGAPRFAARVGPRFRQLEYGNALVPFSRFELTPDGIPVPILDTPGARPGQPPAPDEGRVFLALFEQALADFQPHILLTYGGHWLSQEGMARRPPHGGP